MRYRSRPTTCPHGSSTSPASSLFNIGEIEVRVLFVIMVVVVILFQLVLTFLPFGRRLYAIGSNPDAARVAGFPAQRIVFLAFVMSGALAGLAGSCSWAASATSPSWPAPAWSSQSIAAVVVGGVSNMGGSGTVVGAFLGALFIDLLQNSLFRWQVISEFWRDAILGMLILLAVAARLRRLRPAQEPLGAGRACRCDPRMQTQKPEVATHVG